MFVEIGSFEAPKTVLCTGMRPDPDGVVLSFLHSNQSHLEHASERIVGLTHQQLHLVLRDPPPNPVSPFLNLKRENVPAIIEWVEMLKNANRAPSEIHRHQNSIHVDIGTFSCPLTISPFVLQPDDGDVSLTYLDDGNSHIPVRAPKAQHARIAGLSYELLLMAFKNPLPDNNSPFLNLKAENIPRLVERLLIERARKRAPERASHLEHQALRIVTSREPGKYYAVS